MEAKFTIEGMHCSACVAKITAALRELPGVDDVQVTLEPPAARVRSRAPMDTDAVAAALRKAGAYGLAAQALPGGTAPTPAAARGEPAGRGSLFPLFLILAYLAGTVLVVAWSAGALQWRTLMAWFMGGFFLVFSFFKLLNLRGFADSYRSYDLLAHAAPPWGYAYPFVELGLGLAYLTAWQPVATNVVTLVVMLVGAAGVLKALAARRQIRCACLGAVLDLPLTHVSLTEDIGMAAMAAVMLVAH